MMGEALGQASFHQLGNGCSFHHEPYLHNVELLGKAETYRSCKDESGSPLHSVGMIGAKYPNFLAAWRQERKRSQEWLADQVGCSAASVGHWETGERRLTDKWLPKLAKALDVSQGYLLETHPNDVPVDILDIWASIPEDQKKTALRALTAFVPDKTGTEG